jgi:aryl-alcohol dehydrogenase-like predicted oxidoreductase
MALAPWNVLAGGRIRTDAEEERRRTTGEHGRQQFPGDWERTPAERSVCAALERVAAEVGTTHITAVAIAYLLQKTPHVFPIVGGRKVEHLHANIEALTLALTPAQVKAIEEATPFSAGFPHDIAGNGTHNSFLLSSAAHFDRQPLPEAIRPATSGGETKLPSFN